MTDKTISGESENRPEVEETSKPNDTAGFYFSGSLKITDPEADLVLVQTRID
jgi:hypothetical protein